MTTFIKHCFNQLFELLNYYELFKNHYIQRGCKSTIIFVTQLHILNNKYRLFSRFKNISHFYTIYLYPISIVDNIL